MSVRVRDNRYVKQKGFKTLAFQFQRKRHGNRDNRGRKLWNNRKESEGRKGVKSKVNFKSVKTK